MFILEWFEQIILFKGIFLFCYFLILLFNCLFFCGFKIGRKNLEKFFLFIYLITVSVIFTFYIQNILYYGLIILIEIKPWFYTLNIYFSFYFDGLSLIMCILILFVGFIVLLYSIYYLQTDPFLIKFLAYIVLFLVFMLIVVTSDNLLLLLFGWEGVGICSYLLISFWSSRVIAVKSALQAIAVNRVSDCVFILGIILIYNTCHTLDFTIINNLIPLLQNTQIYLFNFSFKFIDITAFFIIIAAFGKSAQYGFHIWLPDAMEGPTPISALIHAATMVTLGVFLLFRCNIFLQYAYTTKSIIITIGLCTVFVASFLGVDEEDSKKNVAYSTCSHLGAMFCGWGLSESNYVLFHVLNHGFFKALLFLSVGNLIHGQLAQEQDESSDDEAEVSQPLTSFIIDLSLLALMPLTLSPAIFSKDDMFDSLEFQLHSEAFYVGFMLEILGMVSIFTVEDLLDALDDDDEIENENLDSSNTLDNENFYVCSLLILLSFFSIFSGILFFNILLYSNLLSNIYFF